jgi:hypothetical protein
MAASSRAEEAKAIRIDMVLRGWRERIVERVVK